MLKLDPERWIKENLQPPVAGVATVAGVAAENEKPILAAVAATPATVATDWAQTGQSVATVASVAEHLPENAIPDSAEPDATVATSATHQLRYWHLRLAKLDPLRPPEGFGKSEWADLVDDSWWLYENFASVAVRQGWGAQGLWGVRVGVPHGGGLAQLMRTSRSVLFSDGIAIVTRLGVQMKRNPECGHGCLLVWEVR